MALLEVLASLREARPSWALHLIAASGGLLAGRAEQLGVPVTVLPFPSVLARLGEWGRRGGPIDRVALLASLCRAAGPAVAYVVRLRRLLRDLRPDVLHTNGLKMHLLGAWARPARAALVWHLHDYPGARPLAARLLRGRLRACVGIVTNSASVAGDARAVLGGDVPIHPVHNAIDLDRFAPDGPRLDLDAAAGLPSAAPGTVRVGLVGTFARWKGHEVFLQAVAQLPPGLAVRAYVIGGPLYHTDRSQYSVDELRALAEEFGVSARVGFTGFVADPAAALRALDVVVHASTEREPFGLVIAEAMACGRPVVVSEEGGCIELIAAEVDALSAPPGDASKLAAQIARLATDPALCRELGCRARKSAERQFQRQRLAGQLALVYQDAAPNAIPAAGLRHG
jgi:glycosyltransferase involved in cell wall biosynthesis